MNSWSPLFNIFAFVLQSYFLKKNIVSVWTKVVAFDISNLKCYIVSENVHALLLKNENDSLNGILTSENKRNNFSK